MTGAETAFASGALTHVRRIVPKGDPNLFARLGQQEVVIRFPRDPEAALRSHRAFSSLADALGIGDWVLPAALMTLGPDTVMVMARADDAFVRLDALGDSLAQWRARVSEDSRVLAALLDFLSGERNRHDRNVLVRADGALRLLDHDNGFGLGRAVVADRSTFFPGCTLGFRTPQTSAAELPEQARALVDRLSAADDATLRAQFGLLRNELTFLSHRAQLVRAIGLGPAEHDIACMRPRLREAPHTLHTPTGDHAIDFQADGSVGAGLGASTRRWRLRPRGNTWLLELCDNAGRVTHGLRLQSHGDPDHGVPQLADGVKDQATMLWRGSDVSLSAPLPAPLCAARAVQRIPPEDAHSTTGTASALARITHVDGLPASRDRLLFVPASENVMPHATAPIARAVIDGGEASAPLGAFGVDEFFLAALDWTNLCRRFAWRIPRPNLAGFAIHLDCYGAHTDQATILWDGRDLTLHMHALVGDSDVYRAYPTQAFVALTRGALDGELLARVIGGRDRGNMFLLFCLGLKSGGDPNDDARERLYDGYETLRQERLRLRDDSRDAADFFLRGAARACRIAATAVGPSYAIVAHFDTATPARVRLRFADGELHCERDADGHSATAEPMAELHFSREAAAAFYAGDADLAFLCRAGWVRVTGDLSLGVRAGLLSGEVVQMMEFAARTGRSVSESNVRYVALDAGPKVDVLGEPMIFG